MIPGEVIVVALTLAGAAITSWIVGRVLPLERSRAAAPGPASPAARFHRWEACLLLAWLLVVVPLIAYLLWRPLAAYGDRRALFLGDALILLHPGGVEWGLAATFLALTASVFLIGPWARLALGRRYAEYREYERLRWGALGSWIWLVALTLVALAVLFTAALFDSYAVFTYDRIRINSFFSASERTYPYEAVRDIRTAPGLIALARNQVDRREYVICFHDGRSWDTGDAPMGQDAQSKTRLANLVSLRSGVPVTELDVLSRQDLSCESRLPPQASTVAGPGEVWRPAGSLPRDVAVSIVAAAEDGSGLIGGAATPPAGQPKETRAVLWRFKDRSLEQVYEGAGSILSVCPGASRWFAIVAVPPAGQPRLITGSAGKWEQVRTPSLPGRVRLLCRDASRIYLAGLDALVRSDNHGKSWIAVAPPGGETAGRRSWSYSVSAAGGLLAFGPGLRQLKPGAQSWNTVLPPEAWVDAADDPFYAEWVDHHRALFRMTQDGVVNVSEFASGPGPARIAAQGGTVRILLGEWPGHALMRSDDGGRSWKFTKLPSIRTAHIAGAAAGLGVDAANQVFTVVKP